MKIRTIAMMLTLLVAGLLIGCGQSIGEDVERFHPDVESNCPQCDLKGIDLKGAYLGWANLGWANLTEADLTNANLKWAILDGAIGADFTGALNVPKKYLKD